jgi:hypothetical protein
MQEANHDGETCPPVMESTDERSERDLVLNVAHAIIGMVRGGDIVEGQEEAGDGLNEEQQKGHTP